MYLRNVGWISTGYTAFCSRRQNFFITTATRTTYLTREFSVPCAYVSVKRPLLKRLLILAQGSLNKVCSRPNDILLQDSRVRQLNSYSVSKSSCCSEGYRLPRLTGMGNTSRILNDTSSPTRWLTFNFRTKMTRYCDYSLKVTRLLPYASTSVFNLVGDHWLRNHSPKSPSWPRYSD
jgi:hypothetical protein